MVVRTSFAEAVIILRSLGRVLAVALPSTLLASACLDSRPDRREPVVTQPTPTPSLTYVVASGDTLSSIAAKFGTTPEALSAANSIDDPDLISVGIELKIPDPHEPSISRLASVDPCEGLRAVAGGLGGLLAHLRSGATDVAEALRVADRLNAELQQLPRSSPAYQKLESAINAAAVTASAAGLGRSNDATSALEKARRSLHAALDDLEKCAVGESH